jgi:hypothetical protein
MDSIEEFISTFPAWYTAGKQNRSFQSGIKKLGYCPYCGIDPEELKALYEALKERVEAKVRTGIADNIKRNSGEVSR